MTTDELIFFEKKDTKPIATGTGLIALDVIINGHNRNEPYYMTGGSCGNVIIILSYFGWHTYPLGRIKADNFSKFIINDLKKWGVNFSFLDFDEKASVPVIIEKVRQIENGKSTHSFSFFCPECNSFLPRYRSITIKQAISSIENLPYADYCYIDRVSSGALKFARLCKDRGAIIFFEPTKIDDTNLFNEFLKISDILKYSNEICITDSRIVHESNVPLIIETQGFSGLIYRLDNKGKDEKWHKMKAFQIKNVVDTAGAGDWCSAGIIHIFSSEKIKNINQLDEKTLKRALKFGQALAGANCKFFGARGSMYALSKEEFRNLIADTLNHQDTPITDAVSTLKLKRPKKIKENCPICNEPKRE